MNNDEIAKLKKFEKWLLNQEKAYYELSEKKYETVDNYRYDLGRMHGYQHAAEKLEQIFHEFIGRNATILGHSQATNQQVYKPVGSSTLTTEEILNAIKKLKHSL